MDTNTWNHTTYLTTNAQIRINQCPNHGFEYVLLLNFGESRVERLIYRNDRCESGSAFRVRGYFDDIFDEWMNV